MPTFAINFSCPAGQIIAQYYNFLRPGREGYRKVHMPSYQTARRLAKEIAKLGLFEMLATANRARAFRPSPGGSKTALIPATRCSTLRTGCACAVGRSQPTRCRTT
jgi:glutamate/tyrosine decarboxylase-like PLP-dependent enzyme